MSPPSGGDGDLSYKNTLIHYSYHEKKLSLQASFAKSPEDEPPNQPQNQYTLDTTKDLGSLNPLAKWTSIGCILNTTVQPTKIESISFFMQHYKLLTIP